MNNKTPRIACLGWGSLIWKPGELPIFDGWKTDGPMLPVEFARESGGQRITLVICDNVDPVRTCWTLLEAKDIGTAMSTLASREGISGKRVAMDIGYCDLSTGMHHGLRANDIAAWAAGHELDGVVWTNLPCGFKNSRHILRLTPTLKKSIRSFSKRLLPGCLPIVLWLSQCLTSFIIWFSRMHWPIISI